jgi:hypothetical protein
MGDRVFLYVGNICEETNNLLLLMSSFSHVNHMEKAPLESELVLKCG